MAYSSAVNRDWKYAYLSSAVQATSHALMRSQNYLILPVLFFGGPSVPVRRLQTRGRNIPPSRRIDRR